MITIRFQTNYNRKLNNRFFTAIRPVNPSKWVIGETYEAKVYDSLNRTKVRIVEIENYESLADIPSYVIRLDSGLSKDEFIKLMKSFYGDYKGKWSVILFKRSELTTKF